MNTQELEQVVLAITQTMLLLNQLFMTKKMQEGMTKVAGTKDKLENVYSSLSGITDLLNVLEDRVNDLVEQLDTLKND